ncbi:MAG: SDR family NAD(P)-dependent oxidoreductase [Patescibacteria group bacterium]|nr:SDR family NAD(P)-dependent oxidoreductase [Patescibacteria group bacterium]MDE2172366.1 SDR family NAD(P)-dependent oxidoreductase [Patescibacteria group bacterium]
MKTVLITGVGRGIGRALAEKFLAENWRVIGTSQSGDADHHHEHLEIHQLDLRDAGSINGFTKVLTQAGTAIDILINNAGILADENETRLIVSKLRQNLEVNLIGTADLTERLSALMSRDGHIIFMSSQAGSLSDMDHVESSHAPYMYPGYKISKAALNMYMRTLAARLHHESTGVIVSAVHPGWVRTDMGGDRAPVLPSQAADTIYRLAISRPPTGEFWFNGEKYPW